MHVVDKEHAALLGFAVVAEHAVALVLEAFLVLACVVVVFFFAVRKEAAVSYEQTDMAISGSSDAIPKAIRSMHQQMTMLAAKIIDGLPKSERNISGLTVAANKQTYDRVVNELDICRKKIAAIVGDAEEANRVYRINLQIFPVTKEIDSEK